MSASNAERVVKAITYCTEIFVYSLTEFSVDDLVRCEEMTWQFICNYDKVMLEITTPLLLSRPCGTIIRASSSFSELVGIPLEDLLGSYRIYEIFSEESYANILELSVEMVKLNQTTKAFICTCDLIYGGDRMEVPSDDEGKQRDNFVDSKNKMAPKKERIEAMTSFRVHPYADKFPLLFVFSIIPMIHM